MYRIFITLLLLTSSLMADVKSTKGQIEFKTQIDNQAEMTLNSTGLGIGITPSTNLHVNGNATITDQVFVGGSSGSSNLNVNGTLGYGFQTVTSSTTLSGNSIVLADTSSGNIVLRLPEANSYEGRQYTIKKTSTLNNLFIRDGGFIDDYSDVTLSVNNMGSLSLISNSGNWHILNISGNGDLIATDNLVGWWKLDETSGSTVSDSSGKNNVGSITNVAAGNIGVVGKLNHAIDFDGINDHILIADNPSIGNDIRNRFSISIWFNSKVTLNTTDGTYRMLEKGDAYFLLQGNGSSTGTGGMNFLVKRSNINYYAEINQTLNSNQWYHIATTFDGSDLRIYLNGTLKDTTNVGGAIDDDNLDLRIGSDDSGLYFNGKLDDVRIYSKTLTLAEIQALYSQGQ